MRDKTSGRVLGNVILMGGVILMLSAPAAFAAGAGIPVEVKVFEPMATAKLMCRHFHQGERYSAVTMEKKGDVFGASIPAELTNSAFGVSRMIPASTVSNSSRRCRASSGRPARDRALISSRSALSLYIRYWNPLG